MTIDPAVLAPRPPPSSLPSQPPPSGGGSRIRRPPHVAFGQTSSDPRVTFAQKAAFDTFAQSLGAAAGLNRARNAYDAARPLPLPPREQPQPLPPAGDAELHRRGRGPNVANTRAADAAAAVVRATRELAESTKHRAGSGAGAMTQTTPLQDLIESRAREASRPKPDFDRVPAHIPLAQDMLQDAAKDRGVNYPNGPFEPFSWVFTREPGPADAHLPPFRRHHRRLVPVHADESLGLDVDLRLLTSVERTAEADEREARREVQERYGGASWGKKQAPSRLDLAHRPGAMARGAHPLGAAPLPQSEDARRPSLARGGKGGATLVGRSDRGGGYWIPGERASGHGTRRVVASSAYATRLIAKGRVGGVVRRTDELGRPVGNAIIGIARPSVEETLRARRDREEGSVAWTYDPMDAYRTNASDDLGEGEGAAGAGEGLFRAGGGAGATKKKMVSLGAGDSAVAWRSATRPMRTSLEAGNVAGLPRHSAARAKVRREESFRKSSVRASATRL